MMKDKSKDYKQITSEVVIKNSDNRFEYVNSVINKISSEISEKKLSGHLDDEINIVARMMKEIIAEAVEESGISEEKGKKFGSSLT